MATRTWLLTWTTYGTWLPGDSRGFVSDVRDHTGEKVRHNTYGTEYDRDSPALKRYAQQVMRGGEVYLTAPQAEHAAAEFRRTAGFRGWVLHAVAVMRNHAHLVLTAPDNVSGSRLLQEFKSYGSRSLNSVFGTPDGGTWWTKSGSTRLLTIPQAVESAIEYVRRQDYPLMVWIAVQEPATPVAG
jgi:REP element-mobilizing transposase RayT